MNAETLYARPGWTNGLRERLPPGAHVALFDARSAHCVEGRRAGLEFRDAILVVASNGLRRAALFRIPMEGTVAAQVLATGTGAMWIDGCRISTDETITNHTRSADAARSKGRFGDSKPQETHQTEGQALGRWPTNVLLAHKEGCSQDGTRIAKATSIAKAKPITAIRRTGVHADAGGHQAVGREQPVTGYADEDGNESIPAWTCEPGCPVAALDAQSIASGIHSAGGARKKIVESEYNATSFDMGRFGDTGGASRFYPQLEGRAEVIDWITRLIGGPAHDPPMDRPDPPL